MLAARRAEIREIIKHLLAYGARFPKVLMLYVKDLLFLDGDQSRAGAREAYDAWARFLKPGGVIALHNSRPENQTFDHDGYRCLAEQKIKAPDYRDIKLVRSTTFATKC